jgi:ElaB/YqjD/DUF883 family membrane-anchored ribosome-binding protein
MSTTTTQPPSHANSAIQNRLSAERNRSLKPTQDIVDCVRDYVRQKPDVTALWCFGLGIVVGWKTKPW